MPTNRKKINLALQGGGAHGAFTWGVLDRLLEDDRLEISAVSGTSAGAMNAVALADGFTRAGSEGAREALDKFWRRMSAGAQMSPIKRSPIDMLMGNWSLDQSPGFMAMDFLSRVMSPYQLNPLNMNPLRELIEDCVDFEMVRKCRAFSLFISATNVETGKVKVFDRESLTADMVMASACLPTMFQAVIIDGTPYWDGGYMGNPALFPFHYGSPASDIVVIQINPIIRKGVPKSAQEIQNRINEISFNSSLLKELRAIDFVRRLVEEGHLTDRRYRATRVHIIENEEAMKPLGASSKMNAEWAFLTHLRDLGRDTAEAWLDRNYAELGRRSTVDLREMFQGIGATHHG
jgi:NTE family protein